MHYFSTFAVWQKICRKAKSFCGKITTLIFSAKPNNGILTNIKLQLILKTTRSSFATLAATILPLAGIFAQSEPTDTLEISSEKVDLGAISLLDDPFAKRLDSLIDVSFFVPRNNVEDTKEFTSTEGTENYLAPDFPDSVYQQRLADLDALSPLALDFNNYVKAYIDVYGKKRREQVSRMLGLSQYYFPMFEEALDRHNMPLELKYLAIVESALNPKARSRVGATGLWQFMYATGKMNGLQVSSYVDERSDPLQATEAACQYLQKLYSIFGDWNLALAAYNSGPGNVNKAIRRSGGKRDYWEIRPYLPRETAGYVPAFIAVNYIMNHAADHAIYPTELKLSYFQTDTISIREKISFAQISNLINVSEEELEFLNPSYRYKVIPKRADDPYKLVLPSQKAGLFTLHEDSIYVLALADFEQNAEEQPEETSVPEKTYHTVRRGESLGVIAERYGVGVSSLKRWNGMRGTTIRPGQRLAVYPKKMPATASASKPAPASKNSDGSVTHKVRSGESFYSIAKRYPGISAANIMKWNSITNARSLRVGMLLKIFPSN